MSGLQLTGIAMIALPFAVMIFWACEGMINEHGWRYFLGWVSIFVYLSVAIILAGGIL